MGRCGQGVRNDNPVDMGSLPRASQCQFWSKRQSVRSEASDTRRGALWWLSPMTICGGGVLDAVPRYIVRSMCTVTVSLRVCDNCRLQLELCLSLLLGIAEQCVSGPGLVVSPGRLSSPSVFTRHVPDSWCRPITYLRRTAIPRVPPRPPPLSDHVQCLYPTRPSARSGLRGGCRTQFYRLKLELTLKLTTAIEFDPKNRRCSNFTLIHALHRTGVLGVRASIIVFYLYRAGV